MTAASQTEATFDTMNPATGEVIATFPVCGPAEVEAAVQRAREAAAWWAGLDAKERRLRLLAWKSYLTRYLSRLSELVHQETGKPLGDAKLEIVLAILHLDWAAKNARKVLGARRVRSYVRIVLAHRALTSSATPVSRRANSSISSRWRGDRCSGTRA